MQRIGVVLLVLVALSSCATMENALRGPDPLSVSEIVDMSRAGVPSSEICSEIQRTGTVYRLSASQLADLRQQGVPDDVINYMQKTYLEAVAADSAFAADGMWTMEDDGFWYGGSPYGWPGPMWIR